MSIATMMAALLLAGTSTPPDTLPPEGMATTGETAAATPGSSPPEQPGLQVATEVPLAANPAATPDTASDQAEQNAIVVTARQHVPGDPFQAINIQSFEITQSVDRALVRPLAKTYQRVLPDPLRSGFRNVLNNLREPVAFLNFLLQFKPGKAAETAARFAINSSIGAAGLFDIAKRRPFHLPRRINGFAYTLGYYGVKSGPFLFLPLVGPTTLRDFIGDGLDRLFLPVVAGKPFNRPVYAISIGAFSSLDQRAEFDEKLEALHQGSADPYAATREDYLRHRQDIIDGLHNRRPAMAPAPVTQAVP